MKNNKNKELVDVTRREKIKGFLAETGLKPYALEDLAGVGRNCVYGFIQGDRTYFLDTWYKIKDAMAEYRADQRKAS